MVAARKLDTTIYPDTDNMGEGELQQLINELLRPLLARFLAVRGKIAHVGSNTFLYYKQFDSSKRIAPDVYVLQGVEQEHIQRSWKLWELARPPSFALEVVSLDVDKDYGAAPAIHDEIGTSEVVICDPEGYGRKGRYLWQVYRRSPGKGLEAVVQTNARGVPSRVLGCMLVVAGRGDGQRIRLATDSHGKELFPTEAEAERAAKEAERAEKEAERAARATLEAENVKLKREIARLRSAKGRLPKR